MVAVISNFVKLNFDYMKNFSCIALEIAKLAFFMLHSGQKWSKVNLKKIWPFCYEKDQARALWWNFQLARAYLFYEKSKRPAFWSQNKFQISIMRNGNVSIFYVAQWSKMDKSQFEKKLTTVFWKKSGKGCMVKISAL